MEQKGFRLKVMSVGSSSIAHYALAVLETFVADNRDCYTCRKNELLSWNCPLFHNAEKDRTS